MLDSIAPAASAAWPVLKIGRESECDIRRLAPGDFDRILTTLELACYSMPFKRKRRGKALLVGRRGSDRRDAGLCRGNQYVGPGVNADVKGRGSTRTKQPWRDVPTEVVWFGAVRSLRNTLFPGSPLPLCKTYMVGRRVLAAVQRVFSGEASPERRPGAPTSVRGPAVYTIKGWASWYGYSIQFSTDL